jgi:hypothetical protein
MVSASSVESEFKEYEELGPCPPSIRQYLVVIIHFILAIGISLVQFQAGLDAWFQGFGIVTPILLSANGLIYTMTGNQQWYREQMVPFLSGIVTVTEIEGERYMTYHRRIGWYTLVLGWFAILTCQMAWTLGLTVVMPAFSGGDFITRLIGELVAYAVIFGPFILYGVLIIVIFRVFDQILPSRNQHIRHLLEIERKWSKERRRRARNPKSARDKSADGSDHWSY